ncbi:MAG: purine-nucleoside phosphorylase [Lentisphaeria bacterium]
MQSLKSAAQDFATVLPEFFPAGQTPKFFIQTGSGFAIEGLLDDIAVRKPLSELPGMPAAESPAGHSLQLISGWCCGTPLLVCEGRRHLYEGQGTLSCVLPTCAAKFAGITAGIFLAAAGGVNPDYRPGTLMVLTDFINNLGTSPLIGRQSLGADFFPAMNEAYSPALTSAFLNATAEGVIAPRVGTYQANLGPQYETPAEVEIARRNGADAVGMSVVLETIAARALSMEVLGIVLITNNAGAVRGPGPTHKEVRKLAADMSPEIMRLLRNFIAENKNEESSNSEQ